MSRASWRTKFSRLIIAGGELQQRRMGRFSVKGGFDHFGLTSILRMAYPHVTVTDEMLRAARPLAREASIRRTQASPIDALTGALGEMVFAQHLFGDWHRHQLGVNKGKTDFGTIEIKASAFPFHSRLHLLVREDYAAKRKPLCYVQIIFNVATRDANDIPINTHAVLCGFATSEEVDQAPLKDFGSKLGDKGGYRCRYIPLRQLHPMSELRLV